MITKFFIMQFPLDSCYFAPLRTKYSPQHPVLSQPHSMFVPHCKICSFTPIQNNRQNYSSIYFNRHIFPLITQVDKIRENTAHIHTRFELDLNLRTYEDWNFNSGNYLFTTAKKYIHVSKFYCPSL